MNRSVLSLLLILGLASGVDAGHHVQPFTTGTPEYGSLGTLTFGPDNVLFIGDSQNGQILAIQVTDPSATTGEIEVEDIDEKIAAMIGTRSRDIRINDMAVNPASGTTYLTVARESADILMRALPDGKLEHVPLDNVSYAQKNLTSVVSKEKKNRRGRSLRREAITDLVFSNGELYVAGLSNEEFASTLRILAYPFDEKEKATSVEIFHAAHGDTRHTRQSARSWLTISLKSRTSLHPTRVRPWSPSLPISSSTVPTSKARLSPSSDRTIGRST